MPYTTFTSPVTASLETLWGMLVDKVENPQRYITEVEEVNVIEKYEDGILREMKLPKMQLKERITINEEAREIKFTLAGHPLFSGEIINKIDSPLYDKSGDTLMLTFTQNWQALNEEAGQINQEEMAQTIKNAVLHLKQLAEEKDAIQAS
ncbi:AtaL-like protein [Microcoleus sp. FACHB-672]|uniref:AtaL-like protein n=1 Tax=Microcoleus sp. FACHB-672 TaxID=2692825 RepID=UPI0016834393|nr:AtaL-like protein [Microcoleus sp. FACHB-672]MBD2043721.1 DUF1857 family protein [Microcoleus sp. FACHB-672]